MKRTAAKKDSSAKKRNAENQRRAVSSEKGATAEESKATSTEEDTTAKGNMESSAEDNTAAEAGSGPTAQQGTNVEANGTADQDIYDVILFFGQSNMVGESLKTGLLYGTDHASIAEVSARTGVDMDILMNTQDCQLTYVPLQDDTAYQYSLIDDEIYPIEAGSPTGNFGRAPRAVAWDAAQGEWTEVYWNQNVPVAFGYSDMINMVPEFCHTYYQRTGHKVIAVSCALGGVPIRAYLPMDDRHYQNAPATAEVSYAYMYKGVVDSFTGAVQKAREKGWTIGGKYFVSFQGEADLYNASYNDAYLQVIRQWQQLGITDGALVETSFTIGDPAGTSGVRAMHSHQEQLITENPDIVLGSAFDYDHYVPDAASYNSYWKKMWNNISYEDAYTTARYLTDAAESNRVHLNSAALSQIGRETAENLADHILP